MTTRQSMFMMAVAALTLGWATTAVATELPETEFPATGQTTCSDSDGAVIPCAGTGQDGDLQMGARLRYRDKRNGTIRDKNTGFYWEKKSDDDGIHDRDNVFTWEEALDYAATLNNICEKDETISCSTKKDCKEVGGKCGFAGKRDWRLPNVKELQSIVNYEILYPGPTVSKKFNTNCVDGATVLTGSCTAPSELPDSCTPPPGAVDPEPFTYWTSTSGDAPGDAWFIDFITGDAGAHGKVVSCDIDGTVTPNELIFAGRVRAVRGGARRGPR